MRNSLAIVALVLLFCGCVTPPPADPGGNANFNGGNANTNGSAVLPAGIFVGTVSVEAALYRDGQLVALSTPTRNVTETITADGVPQVSSGRSMVVGDSLVVVEVAGTSDVVNARVDSITESGNQLLLALTLSGSRQVPQGGSVPVSGTGSTTYTKISDTEIDFVLSLDYQGVNTDGSTLRQTEQHQGRLIKLP